MTERYTKEDALKGVNFLFNIMKKYRMPTAYNYAYLLATADLETGGCFQPLREGNIHHYKEFSDQEARLAVKRLFIQGKISKNYAKPDKHDRSYYGRGYVQLTHKRNYKRIGRFLNRDLHMNPDLALVPAIAARILIKGTYHGWFTGIGLSDVLREDRDALNFKAYRNIINNDTERVGDQFQELGVHWYNRLVVS